MAVVLNSSRNPPIHTMFEEDIQKPGHPCSAPFCWLLAESLMAVCIPTTKSLLLSLARSEDTDLSTSHSQISPASIWMAFLKDQPVIPKAVKMNTNMMRLDHLRKRSQTHKAHLSHNQESWSRNFPFLLCFASCGNTYHILAFHKLCPSYCLKVLIRRLAYS